MEKPKPNKLLYPLLISFGIIIFLGGIYYLNTKMKNKQDDTEKTSQQASLPAEVTVRLTANGFIPKSVKIKTGGAVRWINETGEDATVNSDDHPNHTLFKELNLGVFGKGSTLMLIFNKTGTFTYHDHFNPQKKGTVVVE